MNQDMITHEVGYQLQICLEDNSIISPLQLARCVGMKFDQLKYGKSSIMHNSIE